jgi:putative membrane protein
MKKSIFYILPLLLSICLISCDTKRDSPKEQAEEQNDDKFENRKEEKGDAKFVVSAMEDSYELLQLAKLAEQKAQNPAIKVEAKKIISAQQQVIQNLETYAKNNDVSLPNSPEEISPGVKKLNDEDVEKFDKRWSDEMSDANKNMIKEFEDYRDKADGSLEEVVNSSLTTLRQDQEIIEKFDTDDDNNDNNN